MKTLTFFSQAGKKWLFRVDAIAVIQEDPSEENKLNIWVTGDSGEFSLEFIDREERTRWLDAAQLILDS